MNFKELIIPLKYKFLAVLLFITLSALGVFFYFTNEIFSEDKKLFVMDLNLTYLRATISEIKLELKTRLEELQIIIPRVYRPNPDPKASPFEGLPTAISDELLRVTFHRKIASGKTEMIREYKNSDLLTRRTLVPETLNEIDKKHPIDFTQVTDDRRNVELINRSVHVPQNKGSADLAVLTFILPGSFVDSDSKEIFIVVDVIQDFLRKALRQSDVAEIFLLSKRGNLLSHSLLKATVDFAGVPYQHPAVQRLQQRHFPRESFEAAINGEPYLCNISTTDFNEVFAVSQIRKSEAFAALTLLMEKSVLIAALILCVAVIISVVFAARLTSNIQKLKWAAEQIGTGNLDTAVHIDSNDEVQSVSQSFQWMVNRLKELIVESAQKARMEDELATARLVQSTLLTTPEIQSPLVELAGHYVPASECGGDVWDANLDGNTLTVFIADATGHGAAAAIVTAVAKACFNTLNAIYAGQPLTPEQYCSTLNAIIHGACKGKILMTMCIIQVNLESRELVLCNAGHESPLCLRYTDVKAEAENADKKRRHNAEVLFARGERLGFDPATQYESVRYQLNEGDTVLLYTDGISEAHNVEGKEWGERALKKAFAKEGPRPIETIRTQIVEAVEQHTQGAQQDDDVTFVLVGLRRQQATSPLLDREVWAPEGESERDRTAGTGIFAPLQLDAEEETRPAAGNEPSKLSDDDSGDSEAA